MKKSAALSMMLGMAIALDPDRIATKQPERVMPDTRPKYTPFAKQEGVLDTIRDYHLILDNKSKKGLSKQRRIKDRVETWLKSGRLKQEDLNI